MPPLVLPGGLGQVRRDKWIRRQPLAVRPWILCRSDGEWDLPAGCTLDFGDREVVLEGTIRAADLTIIAGRLHVRAAGKIQGGSGATSLLLQSGASHDGSLEVDGAIESSAEAGGGVAVQADGADLVGARGRLEASAGTSAGHGGLIQVETDGEVTPAAGSAVSALAGDAAELGGEVDLHSGLAETVLAANFRATGGSLARARVTAEAGGSLSVSGPITVPGLCTAVSCSRGGVVQLTAGSTLELLAPVSASGASGGFYSGDGAGGEVALGAEGGIVVVAEIDTGLHLAHPSTAPDGSVPSAGNGVPGPGPCLKR